LNSLSSGLFKMGQPRLFDKSAIQSVIDLPALMKNLEKGLILYSEGHAVIPPIGFLHLNQPPGDVHIKFGYFLEHEYYVIKIASGFYNNPTIGLPSSQGLMLLFKQKTGELEAILLDEGFLTDLRTAIVGAICAKQFAPSALNCIGIVGTGTQARYQLNLLKYATDCRQVLVWGRHPAKVQDFLADPHFSDFSLKAASSLEELGFHCRLIVTATTSSHPLLFSSFIQPGTHITAVGADGKGKQELDPHLLQKADLVIADSLQQCQAFGDLSYVKDLSSIPRLMELGQWLKNKKSLTREKEWITIADLTGVAVADIQIAQDVYKKLSSLDNEGRGH
jgi:ornithine cyclodeaminase